MIRQLPKMGFHHCHIDCVTYHLVIFENKQFNGLSSIFAPLGNFLTFFYHLPNDIIFISLFPNLPK